jgi:acyl-ACP--UDP-N-acetylglucosamine O-acyltransferase
VPGTQGACAKDIELINTKIGKNNTIFPFDVIVVDPQDLKFQGEESQIIIGDNNKIREHVTIHLGTKDGAMVTKIGNNCLLMVGVHIAHDCLIGNNVILANNATLAGHVQVGDNVVIGGLSALHQFVRIGSGAMIGGMSGVESDVIPFGLVMGEALASEWRKIDYVAHKTIATPEGRKGFLKIIEFSSPASKELGIQAAIDKEILAIP